MSRRAKPQPKAVAPATGGYTDIWIAIALSVAVLAAYAQVGSHEFLNFDDLYYVHNPQVLQGLSMQGLVWAFQSVRSPDFWFPLTLISHMLDRSLFGDQSGLHHLMSVAIHLASSVLLFFVFRRATGARWPSAFVAATFALHPLHVESVAWAAERKDVLCALFWILCMWAYLRYVEKPDVARYAVTALLFACALMSKPMAVSLPFVLLLMDFWPLRRNEKISRLLLEKLPLAGLSVAVSAITFYAQQSGGAAQTVQQFSLPDRIANSLFSYAAYIFSFLWPADLAVFYPYRQIPAWEAAGAAVLLILISAGVWRARQEPYLAVGWLWFLVTLVPAIGLVQVGEQARADRFTYLPSIGLSIMLAWGMTDLFARQRWSATLLAGIAAVVCGGWFLVTFVDLGYWHDNVTLFRHAIEVTSDNYIAYDSLGAALRQQGQVDEAIPDFENAVRIRPSSGDAQVNLGEALLTRGRAADALPHLQTAAQLQADSPYSHLNLGNALNATGKPADAEAEYRRALQLAPNLNQAHQGLGSVLTAEGKTADGLAELKAAVQGDPQNAQEHYMLGRALLAAKQTDEAIVEFRESVRLQPDYADGHLSLGTALATRNQAEAALVEFRTASRLSPEYPIPHYDAGLALADLHRYSEAVAEFAAAVRLKPDFENARRNLEFYSARAK